MPKKRFSAEQIVTLLRQIEVLMAQGNLPGEPAGMPVYRSRVIIAGAGNMVGLRSIRRSG